MSPSIESIVGSGEPSNRSAAYGSSSKIVKPWARAISSSVRRFRLRERAAGRVLEVGDDVGELRLRAGRQHPLDRRHVDPVRLELDRAHVRPAAAQRQQRAVVRGALHDHQVARLDERLEQERVGLHRAVGDHHLLGLDLVVLGDPLAQRRVPDRGAVRGDAARVGRERLPGRRLQPFDVDDVERWGPPGERNRLCHCF